MDSDRSSGSSSRSLEGNGSAEDVAASDMLKKATMEKTIIIAIVMPNALTKFSVMNKSSDTPSSIDNDKPKLAAAMLPNRS